MSKAWSDAVQLLGNNFGLVATIVGLFYFLPSFAIGVFLPELADPAAAAPVPADNSDPQAAFRAMMDVMQETYLAFWPFLLLTTIASYIGSIAVLALFSDRANPTVGDALKAGILGAPTYLASQVLFALALGAVIGFLVAGSFAILPALGILIGIVGAIFAVYASVKLVLIPAVIGVEGERNPITAIKRSWQLTKGNSVRIFIFLVVLLLVISLISLIASMAFGVVFALIGGSAATIGTALISSVTSSIMGAIFLCVLAAIHRQLTGDAVTAQNTFE